MAVTTISVEGDKAFANQLKKLAALREQTVGQLVRSALDKAYGDDLVRLAESPFFTTGDASTHRISEKASTHA